MHMKWNPVRRAARVALAVSLSLFLSPLAVRSAMAAAHAATLPSADAPLGPSAPNAVILVNTTTDEDVVNGFCSLREAIIAANTNVAYKGCPPGAVGLDTIQFIGTVTQIDLVSELPEITEAVNVSGALPSDGRARLNAAALAMNADVFQIDANSVAISDFQIYNLATGNGSAVHVVSGQFNAVFFNHLGLTSSATNCSDGGITRQGSRGITLQSGSSQTSIYGNVIGCNTSMGVYAGGSDDNSIGLIPYGNFIGIKDDLPMPNNTGVLLDNVNADGAQGNIIKNNDIAGNTAYGIRISGDGNNIAGVTSLNVVIGNRIGLRSNGKDSLPNSTGVRVEDGANVNRIGGTADSDRNIISGNQLAGVSISGSDLNSVLGNYIGVTITGTEVVTGQNTGVGIFNGQYNEIGCRNNCAEIKGNRIGGNNHGVNIQGGNENIVAANEIGVASGIAVGNLANGVWLRDGAVEMKIGSTGNPSWANKIANNYIGVAIQGSTTTTNFVGINSVFANALHGVSLANGAHNNVVQGTSITGNGVTYNYGDGIYQDAGSLGNRWSQISTSSNTGLGIDVGASNESSNIVNDPGVTFTKVEISGLLVNIEGLVANVGGSGTYDIELYRVALDPSTYGEGRRYVGMTTLGPSGKFALSLPVASAGGCLTAFVTHFPALGDGQSSEFSRSSCTVFIPHAQRDGSATAW